MATPEEDYKAFKFTPTEVLVLGLLMAATRLGESVWTFENRIHRTLERLKDGGLINFKPSSIKGYTLVWFTKPGKILMFPQGSRNSWFRPSSSIDHT